MRNQWSLAAAVAVALAMSACGGDGSSGSGGSSTPTSPSTTTPSPVTINIVGVTGNAAFTPNPVQVASSRTLMWTNSTSVDHHIVMDDGSGDFGNIAPGASSAAMAVPAGGGNYHCVNHPTMVGSINGATAPEPPDENPVDY